MDTPPRHDLKKEQGNANMSDEKILTAEQRELLDSLHKSFQQAEQGEVRPAREFLRELRRERQAEDDASRHDA